LTKKSTRFQKNYQYNYKHESLSNDFEKMYGRFLKYIYRKKCWEQSEQETFAKQKQQTRQQMSM
jgi:hypothetical protein